MPNERPTCSVNAVSANMFAKNALQCAATKNPVACAKTVASIAGNPCILL